MKTTLIVLIVMLVGSTFAASKCRVFKCGTITQGQGEAICVKGDGQDMSIAQACPTKEKPVCESISWMKPSDGTKNATCGNKAAPMFPPAIPEGKATAVDGDFCDANVTCYASPKANSTCTANKCVISTKKDSSCEKHADCPRGHHCDLKNLNTCLPLKKAGEECMDSEDCMFGTTCLKTEGSEKFNCTASNSLEDGAIFTLPDQTDQKTHYSTPFELNVCKSGYQFAAENKLQCRPRSRSQMQGDDKRETKDGAGVDCNYTMHGSETLADWKNATNATTQSLCGFNKVESGFCQLHPGDDEVVKTLDGLRGKVSKMDCHISSGKKDGSRCFDLDTIYKSDDGNDAHRISEVSMDGQRFANIAKNDKCVAETITADLWTGRFARSAFLAVGTAGLVATIFSFAF